MKLYVQMFIFDLINLFQKVRIIALECIRACTLTCPTHVLLPYKKDVVLELAECLDDHKRMVRKNAAEARSSWILIDAPL